MKRSTLVFTLFCMTLITGIVWTWGMFHSYFNIDPTWSSQLSKLEKEVEKQRFNNTLLTYQVREYEELLTQLHPKNEFVLTKISYYKKGNAETHDRVPASINKKEVDEQFAKGLLSFRNKKFKEAAALFEKFQEKYPSSEYLVKSQFFTAESYYLAKDYKRSMDSIDLMVTQFPDNDLTGFILLRMGQISEENNQVEVARSVYKTVLRSFQNPELKGQAKRMLETIEGHQE